MRKMGFCALRSGFPNTQLPQRHLGSSMLRANGDLQSPFAAAGIPSSLSCPFPQLIMSSVPSLSHPMSFPTHPSAFFFLYLLFLVQCFSQWGPQGFGQNDESVGSPDSEHPKHLALPLVLHVADSFGWHWKLLDCPSHAVAGALVKAHRGALDSGPRWLPPHTAGVRLMKRGTATLLFYPRPWGPLSPV